MCSLIPEKYSLQGCRDGQTGTKFTKTRKFKLWKLLTGIRIAGLKVFKTFD